MQWVKDKLQMRAASHFDFGDLGRPVQVDPIKPNLKPPGTKRLKLNCNNVLSTFAFDFILR